MPSADGAARPLLSHHLRQGLVADATGRASTGRERILDVVAMEFHQRVPLWIGSPDEVARAESFHRRSPA